MSKQIRLQETPSSFWEAISISAFYPLLEKLYIQEYWINKRMDLQEVYESLGNLSWQNAQAEIGYPIS